MVTTLTAITFQRSLDTYKSSNTDEILMIETHDHSCVYYKLNNNTMQNYITHYVTGSDNLKTILDQLDNDPLVGDYDYEIESQGATDEDHMYCIMIIPCDY